MPNDSTLPKPNIPNPNQTTINKDDQGGGKTVAMSSANDTKVGDVTKTGNQDQSFLPKSLPKTQASSPPISKKTQGSATQSSKPTPQQASLSSRPPQVARPTVSSPAGLDPQSPGGPLPKVNQQGQVLHTSTISQTPQSQDFTKQAELPVSKMQQIQQRTANLPPSQQAKKIETTAINPSWQANNQQTTAPVVDSQQVIQPTLSTSSQQKQPASVTHPSLGSNIPAFAPSKLQKTGLFRGKLGAKNEQEAKSTDLNTKPTKKGKTTTVSATQPQFAKPEKPVMKFVLFGALGLLILVGVIFGISKILGEGGRSSVPDSTEDRTADQSLVNSEGKTDSVTSPGASNAVLTYWGLWEPEKILIEVLTDFQKKTGIVVNYEQKSHKDYRTHLQTAIASGAGPDVFRFHASWVPMLKNELAPIPSKIMSLAEYEQTFFPVAVQQLQDKGQLVGIPLMYDGLALYYNKDVLQTANEEPPQTWAELRILANKLTVRSGNNIERGGLAIGNVDNVEHFADIIGLLILQNGGNPAEPLSGEVRDAIQFYASFARSTPVFSTTLPSSTVAFARGEVAMMLAPSWRVHEVKGYNPDLNFGIVPAPKLSDDDFGWANYWAEGVSDKSNHKDEAWQFLKYLSSKEVLQKLYSEQSQLRAFGEIYPRQDMMSELNKADYVGAYLQDAPKATSWYMCSFTHDAGINDRIIDYYKDAISIAVEGNLSEKDLQTLSEGVTQTLRQYGL